MFPRRNQDEDDIRQGAEFVGATLRNAYLTYRGLRNLYEVLPTMTPAPKAKKKNARTLRGSKVTSSDLAGP